MKNNKSILVAFGSDFPKEYLLKNSFDIVLRGKELEAFINPGSIYEASAFAEELSLLKLPDGSRVTKSFIYKGYELWWLHYDSLFLYFGLPYSQYKKLLEYLKDFGNIYLYESSYKSLFFYYLQAHGCKVHTLSGPGFKSPAFLPFGVMLQILITLLCLPVLILRKNMIMIFIGDKIEKGGDFDARMRFIYQELRQKDLPFVEFIRSLESWKTVLKHFFIRKRPVIYSEAVAFMGRFAGLIFHRHPKVQIHDTDPASDPEDRFKLSVATHNLKNVYADISAIEIMRWILDKIGVRSAFFAAALERNLHAVLGAKLNNIPTVGILHGVASKYYNGYDFLPTFDGEKHLSVDNYGLWSGWWKGYYAKYSRAYRPEQLFVSGPMRPLVKGRKPSSMIERGDRKIRILFISEQVAVPKEVLPYLNILLGQKDIEITFIFRPYRDGFRDWLSANMPDIFQKNPQIKIASGNLEESIHNSDVIVGSYSTAVLESLLQLRMPIFYRTQKWGDYYDIKNYKDSSFFAENPQELIAKIKNARSIPIRDIEKLRDRYFGDPYKNGSKWAVDRLEQLSRRV